MSELAHFTLQCSSVDGYVAMLQRFAVLSTLMPGTLRLPASSPAIPKAVMRLIYEWRDRVAQLQPFGWPPPGKATTYDQRLLYLHNCLPAFCRVVPQTRCCRYDKICPFCFARNAGSLWPMFVEALPSLSEQHDDRPTERMRGIMLDDVRPAVSAKYHLVERRNRVDIPVGVPDLNSITSQQVACDALRKFLSRRIVVRGQLFKTTRPYGAYARITVEPLENSWRIRTRQLFIVAADDNIEQKLPRISRGVCFRHINPTRHNLLVALANTVKYPEGMLRGNPLLTSILLKASAGLRLSAACGELRKSREPND